VTLARIILGGRNSNPGSPEYEAEMLVALKRCPNHTHRSATPAEEQVTINYTIRIGLGQNDTVQSMFRSRHHYHGRVHVIPPRGNQTPDTSHLSTFQHSENHLVRRA